MAQMGRPRTFDRDEALRRAMMLFWEQGYEGVTLSDLQVAMGGITPPSFYAAFGSKEQLFREAVDLFVTTVGAKAVQALSAHDTARGAVEAMLYESVKAFCGADTPRGCLLVLGAMNCTRANKAVQDHLLAFRRQVPQIIKRRLERGVTDGDLSAAADLAAMAAFYATVQHGLAISARDGAPRIALTAAVSGAMAAWSELATSSTRLRARKVRGGAADTVSGSGRARVRATRPVAKS